jgi:hypothetical protein
MRSRWTAFIAGLLVAVSAQAAPPEPVEVRLLRTVHLGALQGLEEKELRGMTAPQATSYVRYALARAALLVLGKDDGPPDYPVERLLDQALAQLKKEGDLLPPGAPRGYGGDDLIYTLTYALAVSGRGAAAERVLERHVAGGSDYKRCVAMQALHNLGSPHAQDVIQKATEGREIGFVAGTLLVQDQFPPLLELAAHWHDIPLGERSRKELMRDMESGCGPRAILALFLAGYLPPAVWPHQESEEVAALRRAATELPLEGCFQGRMFALRSYGLRTRGAPAIWASLAAHLETAWQRELAVRIGFARYPQAMVPAALDRLAVEPEQWVQWELLWGTLFAGQGSVFRDVWDLWNLAPHRQLRLSFSGPPAALRVQDQDRLLGWLESGRRPADGRVFDWLVCELARSARGPEAFRLLRAYLKRPAAERHAWVLQDLAEPAALPALRYLRDQAREPDDREALARGIGILETGDVNLSSGRAPEICCAPTRDCLLSQYEKQVFRSSQRRLENEGELRDWIADGLEPPTIRFLDKLERIAEVKDGRSPKPLRFEHRSGCWQLIQPSAFPGCS